MKKHDYTRDIPHLLSGSGMGKTALFSMLNVLAASETQRLMLYDHHPLPELNMDELTRLFLHSPRRGNFFSACYTTKYKPEFKLDPALIKRCDEARWNEAYIRRENRRLKKERNRKL